MDFLSFIRIIFMINLMRRYEQTSNSFYSKYIHVE